MHCKTVSFILKGSFCFRTRQRSRLVLSSSCYLCQSRSQVFRYTYYLILFEHLETLRSCPCRWQNNECRLTDRPLVKFLWNLKFNSSVVLESTPGSLTCQEMLSVGSVSESQRESVILKSQHFLIQILCRAWVKASGVKFN